ncbi:hypothetical protein NHF48_012030 [Sphingomonas sp. H160509]|uniref:hypothetical protein n=1 Tax=Sphingomonas sp. H160509 TaxID=2955313 RepID=UPI0020984D3A|nr:hypothetical protein [Sphingomonas sp. H160509]MDD1451539.1 hypothetical protein [Sphingomonas sp. H160509]
MPLALAACDRSSTDQQDLNSLDAELTNGAVRDPALTSSLGGDHGRSAAGAVVEHRCGAATASAG